MSPLLDSHVEKHGKTPWVVFAAMTLELADLRAALVRPRPMAAGRFVAGELAEREVWAGVLGVGPAAAAASAARVAATLPEAARVLFVGLAGALDPALRNGDLVAVDRVRLVHGDKARDENFSGWRPFADDECSAARLRRGALFTVPAVVATAAEKADLWRRLGTPRGAVVDMETAAAAAVLSRRGHELGGLRVVSDSADEDLPWPLRGTGDAQPWKVALRASLAPVSWPALLRLRARLVSGGYRLAEALRRLSEINP